MVKHFVPEFVNRSQGLDYIAAGRGSKSSRPTKDSWNTNAVHDGDDLVLNVSGVNLIRWTVHPTTGDERIVFQTPADHTQRKRINDYVLKPRFNMTIGRDNRIEGWQGRAIGNDGVVQPVPMSIGRAGAGVVIDVTPKGVEYTGLTPLTGKAAYASMDTLMGLANEWADLVISDMESGTTENLLAPACQMCSNHGLGSASFGTHLGNFEHVFAHLSAQEWSIGFLVDVLRVPAYVIGVSTAGVVRSMDPVQATPQMKKMLVTSIKNFF
jgi:hypothetical protein